MKKIGEATACTKIKCPHCMRMREFYVLDIQEPLLYQCCECNKFIRIESKLVRKIKVTKEKSDGN